MLSGSVIFAAFYFYLAFWDEVKVFCCAIGSVFSGAAVKDRGAFLIAGKAGAPGQPERSARRKRGYEIETITVNASRKYDVVIGKGCLSDAGEMLANGTARAV